MSKGSSDAVLGVVPARGGSKGIPRKNLRDLAGRALVEYTLAAAQGSQVLTHTILSTDDEAIAALAEPFAVEVPFLRPAHLAADDTPTLAVVQHLLDWLSLHERAPEVIVLLQPTAPLRRSVHIDEAVTLLLAGDADSVMSVAPIPAHFHPLWQFISKGGELNLYTGEPFSQLVARRQDLAPTYTRNGAIYAFRVSAFRRTGTIYGDRCLGYEMPVALSINLDTEEDWRQAEEILSKSMREERVSG